MAADSPVGPLSQWVPEFHFDLIGRIAPGLLCCWMYQLAPKIDDNSVIIGATWIISAYIIGLLLDVVGSIVTSAAAWPLHWMIKQVCGNRNFYQKYNSIFNNNIVWDVMVASDSSKQYVLLKLLAEKCLFRSVITLSIIPIIRNPFCPLLQDINQYFLAVLLLTIGLIGHMHMAYTIAERMKLYSPRSTINPPIAS